VEDVENNAEHDRTIDTFHWIDHVFAEHFFEVGTDTVAEVVRCGRLFQPLRQERGKTTPDPLRRDGIPGIGEDDVVHQMKDFGCLHLRRSAVMGSSKRASSGRRWRDASSLLALWKP
jgi:hypothetical protein